MEENTKKQKLSYEELEQVASQLSQQSQQLYQRLQHVEMSNLYKRLDYLFKVVENAPVFNEVFLSACIKEIEDIMTISEEDTVTNTEE